MSFFLPLLLFLLTSLSVTAPSPDDELSLLLSFNSSLSPLPPDWDPLTHPDHCQWRGVTCDPTTRHVTSLNLTLVPLTGTIPAALAQLTSLRRLSLKSNNLSGPIPPDLLKMRALRTLDLSFNHLSGEIPAPSPCTSLTRLILTANFLVGEIPPQIGQCTNLKVLSLNQNILEGRIPAEIGQLCALRALDVSRNSLTDRIPREIGQCRNLSTIVLTDLSGFEFNAFIGGLPPELMGIPSLEVLWAPRANLDGGLVRYTVAATTSNDSCRLRVLNLALNYIVGEFPKWLVNCKNLDFLDLSLNYLEGELPGGLGVGCMGYFNVSQNSLSGSLTGLRERNCARNLPLYSRNLVGSLRKGNVFVSVLGDGESVVLHDFSWNNFSGSLPLLSPTIEGNGSFSYGLLLNDNRFNESISGEFFGVCRDRLSGFAVNLSANQIPGEVGLLSSCLQLKGFEAASNNLSGLIPSAIGHLSLLSYLDLRGNNLSGLISDEIGREMTSLNFLDLSNNSLTGDIPASLADASELEVLLLDHNLLSGEIPQSFSTLTKLTAFDVSFNNLSGEIPHFVHPLECEFFRGNRFLHPCPNSNYITPSELHSHTDPQKLKNNKLNSITVAAVVSASVVVSVLVILALVLLNGKRKRLRLSRLRKKVVVIFSNAPAELNYESVVKATGNFSIQNLIGSGGFGATYKAELVPGFLVAVKRLSIGRFQGLQQFDAEIRTLGRIRHKNLVTLIGYHMGEVDTFLIYNYLSGGNLEAFIRKMPDSNVDWPVVHKIALDIAQALAYLHYSCVPHIVHRDIKPSNILLDDKLNAYLSDFGLAKLLEVSETHATTDVAGTFGYVAPEYATTCRVSNKADVYSYGVVLLELISGKRSLDSSFSKYGNGFTIVAWGRLLVKEKRMGEFFCSSFWEDGPKDNLVGMLRLALSCTVESLSVRPSMKQVVDRLKQLTN